ncbi:SDR family oxidoreductase [Gimesia fumaroli]|uniref:NAD dependent epimerase/dehydratase family protein n=1 Tax=Gimesia fumaroli TaxID=2527976 RepID=A0A518IH09_9PLAN|nr:SDR family oxidoreductase [Gimesia fumaroli]QDV52340.1 NAD dependent epimerase/dehydratase family protein [Gimesia fumaroli]
MHKLIIGCGYVGLPVAQKWLEQGHSVSALTRSEAHASEFKQRGITPLMGDITQPDSLKGLPESETVLYAVGFDRSAEKSRREIYVEGLNNVLTEIKQRTEKMIYLSSTSVYGQSTGEWVDETSVCEPERENGQICLAAEQLFEQHGLTPNGAQRETATAVILRLAGIYGPGRLLARMQQIKAGEPLTGRPDAWLNLVHLADIVNTILKCDTDIHLESHYLVSDSQPITRQEYYETLARLLKAPHPQFAGDSPGQSALKSLRMHSTERAAGLNKRCSNLRLRETLGVELVYPTIQEGLPQAIENT